MSAFCELEEKCLRDNSFDIDIKSDDPNYEITKIVINQQNRNINPQGKYQLKIAELNPNSAFSFEIEVETT